MRKIAIVLLVLVCCFQQTSAQVTVKGKIIDTAENRSLSNAVISLLHKKDSTLAKFSRSDKNGSFPISNIDTGRYVLLVTYPRFADFADAVELNSDFDLGSVPLTPLSLLLKEVIVRSGQAIRIKGDTTEFAADSFSVREGATVEELLKKLPGFQVNSKGEITAQGKRVDKVLVDGEEFFGDDPTMATQNISAKAVDKVQVYDTKTEQQQLTGISSGTEGKTVNIRLKEDQKKGAFGKINAGASHNDYVDAKAYYNKFVGKRKIAVYGTKTNVSTGSLSWEERQKLGIEEDHEYDEISGIYYFFGGNDEFNDWNFRGLPDAYAAGALFSNKWNQEKQNINTSYRFNRLGVRNETSTLSQNILPAGLTYSNRFVSTDGFNQQHAVNGKYEWKVDSLTSFKLTSAGSYKNTESFNNTSSEYLNNNREFVNQSNNLHNNVTRRIQADNQLTYRQSFKKKNRLLLTVLRFGIIDDEQDAMVNTQTRFYRNASFSYSDTTDQQKLINGTSQTFGTKVTFNEPLNAKWNLVTEYSYNKNNSVSHRNTFERGFNGKYEVLNLFYSNNFDLEASSHSGSAILRLVDKKVKAAFGTGISSVNLHLFNIDDNVRNRYNFLKLTPQAQVGYTPKPQTNISLNYRGNTRQPTIDQLQPIRNNNDPLNVFIGNPNLAVGFNHSLRFQFNKYKVLQQQGISISASYNLTNNAITNYNIIDSLGRRTFMPVNVNGNNNWFFWGNYNKGRGSKKIHYGFPLQSNGGRYISFVNGLRSVTNYARFSAGFSIGYDNEEKRSFSLSPRLNYNKSKTSLQPNVDNDYFGLSSQFEAFIALP